jgi:hypothetical protein
MQRPDRLGDFTRRFRRSVDAGGMIDQAGDDSGLVADLVQMAGIWPIRPNTGAFMP